MAAVQVRSSALEVDGHEQGGHLLVGDGAASQVTVEQPADLGVGQPLPVPFGPDQLHRVVLGRGDLGFDGLDSGGPRLGRLSHGGRSGRYR
jgi:hypothetical protein